MVFKKMGHDSNRAFQLACEWLKSVGSSYKGLLNNKL